MIAPRFNPEFNWGHVAIAVSFVIGSSMLAFSPREIPLLNKAQIEQNRELIKRLADDDKAQDLAVSNFRAEVVNQLRLQTEAMTKLVTQNAEFNIRLANVERDVEAIKREIKRK